MCLGRIAAIVSNIVFGQLVEVNCVIPMLLVSAFMAFGGLCAIKLPDRASADLA